MQPRVSLCPNCHSQIALGQQFCVSCGARFCPHCCAAVPMRSRFCPNCGFLLGTAQPREAAQPPPPTAAAQPPSPMPIMPSPPYQASPQPATQYQPPEAPGMWQQYNCPQCGASIDIVSGQCTSCGLLLGKNIIQKMQQEATPAAPAASTTPTPINPPSPPSSQYAAGQQYPGGYITGAQHNYPPPDAPAPQGPKYPPNYGLPGATPYSETQQHVASAAPIAMNPPAPAIPFPGKVRPAPGEQGAPLLTRQSLVRIATSLLLAIPILIIIYYAIIQLGITTPSGTDTTPPTIQSISASSVTETTAVIEWVTDEPATSQVSICNADGCTWTEPEETLVTNHSVTLSDLEPGTTYHYTAISKDASGNEAISEGDLATSAQTDTTPPMISEVNVSNINESSSSATIEWKTSEPATSQVEYGTTDDYDSTTPLDDELTTSHSVRLTGLEPDATSYRFRIKSKDASGNEATAIPAGFRAGYRAPDFTLQDLDEDNVKLNDFHGKIVMVNFWFVDCEPCEDEMPYIQAVFDKWPEEELTVLAVNRWESAEKVQGFVDSKNLTFPVLIDSLEEVHDNYNVSVWPTTFFIDTEGIIQEIQVGAFDSQDEIETILESL